MSSTEKQIFVFQVNFEAYLFRKRLLFQIIQKIWTKK